ncbi:MAG: glycosyltransferase family 25 protein [Planctomycetia bacterium]|nr:glycosyltransferase family 25 protein [Planctomycetia bacterium]
MNLSPIQWQCYVINLDRSRDRWERVEQHFAALSIPLIRVPAVDGRETPELEQKPFFDTWGFAFRCGKKVLPGELGCYASHLKAIRTFLASKMEFALICEDDALPREDLEQVLEETIALGGWELLRLVQCREKSFVPWKKLSGNRFLGTNITGFSYAAGYVLSRRGAENVLAKLSVMRQPYDLALFHGWWGIREASVFPCPILLDETREMSTIQTCRQHRFLPLAVTHFFYKCYARIWRYTLQTFRVWQRK